MKGRTLNTSKHGRCASDGTFANRWAVSLIGACCATFVACSIVPAALAAGPNLGEPTILRQADAQAAARQRGWLVRTETPTGKIIELQKLVNGIPMYYATTNLDAAISLSTNDCWPGGTGGMNLNGSGVQLGVWDGGRIRSTHQELTGRVTSGDGTPPLADHSTHVAGTMIGAGVFAGGGGEPAGQSKGMSFAATIRGYDFNSDDFEMNAAAGTGLRVSNHSYGLIKGWTFGNFGPGSGWYWFGDVTVSQTEDHNFGYYSFLSRTWDTIAYNKRHYLIVASAGNDRDEGPAPGTQHFVMINGNWTSSNTARSRDGNGGFDSVGHEAVAKNVLAVGAVSDVINGYSGPGGVSMSSFSCWGPTDDGRIKPDVVGNGVSLFSSFSTSNNAYGRFSGTSMSSPNVAGSLGLLIQHYRATHGGSEMAAATLKGLVIHTADESGAATGPDYTFGWGLVNTFTATTHITANTTNPGVIQELVLPDDQNQAETWTYSGTGPIRATISWTDPPGQSPAAAIDPPAKALVNDLDLRITGPDSTVYQPWVLNPASPSSPATTGDNNSDNVEMVFIPAPGAGTYVVSITHKGTLTDGMQAYSLLLTGLTNGPIVAGACCNGETCTGTNTQTHCEAPGETWYGGADCATFSCPALGACCQGCPPSDTCTSLTSVECNAVDGRWTAGGDCGQVSCVNAGDDCDLDIQAVSDGVFPFDSRCTSTDGPASVSCDNGTQPFSNDLWYAYTASCSGTVTVSLCEDTNFDAMVAVYQNQSATCPCPTSSATQYGTCSDDTCGVGGGPPQLTRDVIAGRCYTIRVGGWSGSRGLGTMQISCEPSGDPSDAPLPGDDLCSGGSNNGASCSNSADCPGGICGSKSRYLTIKPPAASVSGLEMRSIQITIVDIADALSFDAREGEVWWAGLSQSIPNAPHPALTGAPLVCQPTPSHAEVWPAVNIHLFGSPIVPGSTYEVRMCDAAGTTCSDPLLVATGKWGDAVAAFGGGSQPNFTDVSSVVEKFSNLASGPSLPRVDFIGAGAAGQPNTPGQVVNFADISSDVAAFSGFAYPHTVPACP